MKILLTFSFALLFCYCRAHNDIKFKAKALYRVTEIIENGKLGLKEEIVSDSVELTYNKTTKGWVINYFFEGEADLRIWELEFVQEKKNFTLMKDNTGKYWEVINNVTERGTLTLSCDKMIGLPYFRIDGIVKVLYAPSIAVKLDERTTNEWEYFCESKEGNPCYVKEVISGNFGEKKIWVKEVGSNKQIFKKGKTFYYKNTTEIILFVIKCPTNQIVLVEKHLYSEKKDLITSTIRKGYEIEENYENIIPDSLGDLLYNYFCKE